MQRNSIKDVWLGPKYPHVWGTINEKFFFVNQGQKQTAPYIVSIKSVLNSSERVHNFVNLIGLLGIFIKKKFFCSCTFQRCCLHLVTDPFATLTTKFLRGHIFSTSVKIFRINISFFFLSESKNSAYVLTGGPQSGWV